MGACHLHFIFSTYLFQKKILGVFTWDVVCVNGSIDIIIILQKARKKCQIQNLVTASYKQCQKWDICKVGDLVKAVTQDSFLCFSLRHVGQSQLSKLPITECRASELKLWVYLSPLLR